MMWIEQFRQFLNQTFQRFMAWLRGVSGHLPWAPAWLHERLPMLEGLGPAEVCFISDPQAGGWKADVSYHYRSLHCQLRISAMEPTSGMQKVYEALQESRQG
jgi:hypothetical protein